MKLTNRIERLEDLLKAGTLTPMIALKDEHGLRWHGTLYQNEDALVAAVDELIGDDWPRPLIILDRIGPIFPSSG